MCGAVVTCPEPEAGPGYGIPLHGNLGRGEFNLINKHTIRITFKGDGYVARLLGSGVTRVYVNGKQDIRYISDVKTFETEKRLQKVRKI